MKNLLGWLKSISIVAGIFLLIYTWQWYYSNVTINNSNTKPKLEIISYQEAVANSLDGYDIICTVRNNTPSLATIVNLDATFYDGIGKAVGTGFGTGYNIPSNEIRVIKVSSHDILNMSRYDIAVGYYDLK